MVILHIAPIDDSPFSGVSVVVPQHIVAQQEIAQVGFVNLLNVTIGAVKNQFPYCADFQFDKLPQPFNRPDMVVFHETYCKSYLRLYPQLIKRKIPYVIIPHGELSREAQKKKWLKKKVANLLLFNRFINGAKAIQCLSQREMDTTFFGKHRFIGTNGIQIPERKKTSFHTDQTKFLYIGRLDAHMKGLDLMLEAVRLQQDFLKQHNCSLAIYGPDIEGRLAHLQSLVAEKNIGDLVSLNGPVVGQEKEDLLLDADIFIQTSRSEGMPLGILEALGYGLPCLVTEGTTLGGMIENCDAGWSSATDAQEIAKLLRTAVAEKKRYYVKAANAVECVEQHFSWMTIADETIKEYLTLCQI